MCGILGSINFPFTKDHVDLISHRGPDDQGIVEHTIGYHKILFAHARLAIVDLSVAGHQPMISHCGRYVIIFNGEIYNHLDLRAKLQEIRFRGHSDTETILYYIAKYGAEGVKDFNGIFSLAFLDKERGTILLCRDPFGIKPLYYWQQEKKIIFASEIRPIQQLVNDSIDSNHLATLLHLRYSPSPQTLFKNIHKVLPGHSITINLTKDKLNTATSPFPFSSPEIKAPNTLAEASEQYELLFKKAIKRQLMSDVEVGILLSGGIDSALVAQFAQKYSSYPMKAFTVGFTDQDDSDEIQDAQETAKAIGLDSVITRISFNDFLNIFRLCINIVEEPLATTSIIPMYYLSDLSAQNVKVVLSGQGADESLGGYGRYQGELYHDFFPPSLAMLGKRLADLFGVKNEQIKRGLQALQYSDDITRFLSAYTVFSNTKIKKLIGCQDTLSRARLQYFYYQLECLSMEKSVERMMAIDMRMNLSDDLLLYTDKVTMHFALECRVPMLDVELVNYIQALPSHFRVKIRHSKIVHREVARKVLPKSIINRKKKGFQSPTRTWFKEKGPVWDMLLSKGTIFSQYFDLLEVEKILTLHSQGFNQERQIFLLVAIYYWLEEFTDGILKN